MSLYLVQFTTIEQIILLLLLGYNIDKQNGLLLIITLNCIFSFGLYLKKFDYFINAPVISKTLSLLVLSGFLYYFLRY